MEKELMVSHKTGADYEVRVSLGEDDEAEDILSVIKDGFRTNHFSSVLSKIDEVDESRFKSPITSDEDDLNPAVVSGSRSEDAEIKLTQSPHVMWKSEDEIIHIDGSERNKVKQRPKSANCLANVSSSACCSVKKRSNSACAEEKYRTKPKKIINRQSDSESNSESSLVSVMGRPKSAGSKLNVKKRYSLWYDPCSWDTYCYPPRPQSACGMAVGSCDSCVLDSKGVWMPCERNPTYKLRKCRSNPNITRSTQRAAPNSELQIDKFKRSLKLLGLHVSDFGICESGSDIAKYQKKREKRKSAESTFSTKIVRRSMSLDGLKEIVRDAWLDDRLDTSHRKLLAQAAYEEWYFRKWEEAQRKLMDERMRSKQMKEKLENELKTRRIKAEEQFKKWIEGKKAKMRIEKVSEKPKLSQFRMAKTKEEVEVAYLRWKKEKDKQIGKRQKLERKKQEKKLEVERQKEEKKALAEKAFLEWKKKLEEAEKNLAESKLKKEKRKKELERKKRKVERKTSFQTWKDMKDKELMAKRQENRNAIRIANALRSAQLEERMYEAEQAFEEWLEKIEMREVAQKSKKTVS